MAITKRTVKANQEPTKEELDEISRAADRSIVIDDEAPILTEEQYAQLADIARERRAANKKPVVALRINPNTLAKAKATGKGYTGFLSGLLDNAIDDPEMVKKSL